MQASNNTLKKLLKGHLCHHMEGKLRTPIPFPVRICRKNENSRLSFIFTDTYDVFIHINQSPKRPGAAGIRWYTSGMKRLGGSGFST